MKETIAVYAGTFDPVTNGHLDIIKRASKLFDQLYVTIFINPAKTEGVFTVDERMDLLRQVTKEYNNVKIDASNKLAVEYAAQIGGDVLVRGIRANMDFEYELQLAFSNQYLDDNIEMVFLMTKPHQSFISSTSVKEIVTHGKSVAGLVPPIVEEALKKKLYRP